MKRIIFITALIAILVVPVFVSCATNKVAGGQTDDKSRILPVAGTGRYYSANYDSNWEKYKIRENVTSQDIVLEMGMGINMGNTLEATDMPYNRWVNAKTIEDYIRCWGAVVPTQELIQTYADAGFDSLRIPVAWSNLMDMNGYIVHKPLLDLVENVIDWTIDAGMVAVVNMHWDGGWYNRSQDWDKGGEFRKGGWDDPDDKKESVKRYIAIWTQVSRQFEKFGDRLIFESGNEWEFPSLYNQWDSKRNSPAHKKAAFDLMMEIDQIFVDTVRGTGGNNATRHLLVQSYQTNDALAYDPLFRMPNDPANRLILSVHYYTPTPFTIADVDNSGKGPSWASKPPVYWGNPTEVANLIRDFDRLKENVVDKGIPVIIGEFGPPGRNKYKTIFGGPGEEVWFEQKAIYVVAVAEAAYSRGMCPMLWDTPGGELFRPALIWRDPPFISKLMAIKERHPR